MGERAPVPLLLALCLLAVSAPGAEPAVAPDRAARLGEAVALFSAQPRTTAKIAEAARLLESLRTADPADEPGLAATYYLARIAQIQGPSPDRAAAIAAYRALLAAHPENFHAQLAAPKLALLLLYDDVPSAEWERRAAELAALLPRLTSRDSRRDTRLILANALIKLRSDHARAYPHLAALLAEGAIVRKPRLNLLLAQAAESAEALGLRTEAAAHWTRFLAEFPQDAKADEIRRRLARLQEAAAP